MISKGFTQNGGGGGRDGGTWMVFITQQACSMHLSFILIGTFHRVREPKFIGIMATV